MFPDINVRTETGFAQVNVGSSNLGLTADRTNAGCSLFARLFYRLAFSVISFQRQLGRVYTSRFSLNMLQLSDDHGHFPAMAQLGGMLYRCVVGLALNRSCL